MGSRPVRALAGPLTGALAGACAARCAYALLRRYPPAGEKTWGRTNHRGELVTLLEGPALSLGAVAGRPGDLPFAVAGLGALGFGLLDDLRGSGKRRGLRGHLGALARGEVTTGTVKLAGLAATGAAAALLDRRQLAGSPSGGSLAGLADVAINAGLIAGGANLLNLFDLRPGRAIKVATLSAGLIAAGGALAGDPVGGHTVTGNTVAGHTVAGKTATARATTQDPERVRLTLAAVAAPAGAALALLPEDLAERAMLGDAGANALGALLGAAAARSLPRRSRALLLAGIAALTLTSEKVSFTKVIAATPPLHWLDMLGRRAPLPATATTTTATTATTATTGTAAAAPGEDGAPAASGQDGTAATGEETAAARRRRPGRHRRAADTVGRTRSGSWVVALLKSRPRQEP
jgi:UDP-GlcNAc:undecaprenyl-phosphate/decaprenyl-phosphate GlcNAc-1-phosphate transferase